MKSFFRSFFHVVTLIACALALSTLFTDLPRADTVFQQIEVYTAAVCTVVIPYCAARAIEQLAGR